MRKLVILISALLVPAAFAQTGDDASLKGQPVEITATGGTTYEGGVATARDNVRISIGDTDIYADRAQYFADTKIVRVEGNVRIYRGAELYVGESGSYNTETREIEANQLRTLDLPYYLGGERISTISEDATLVQKGSFTTHDAFNPDFQLRATTVRVYEGDRIILKNVTLYIGRVPVFYFPYLYQSLDDAFSFVISPAYMSSWGPAVLTRVSFPITKRIKGIARLDYRVRRGIAGGFDSEARYWKGGHAKLRTYFLKDENPNLNRTSLPRGAIPDFRYRLGLENRTEFGHEIHGIVGVTKLSDRFVLQDFFPSEFRINPEPDNIVALQRYNPLYSLTGYTRFQLNDFYEVTERLPEIALDIKRQPLFGSPIFYEGEASFSHLRRNFPEGTSLQDYRTTRLDTFHQLSFPNTYFGWLSVVPRAGFRATYYTDSRDISGFGPPRNPNPLLPDFLLYPLGTLEEPLPNGGDAYRTFVNAGVEASFKISRTWEQVQSRRLGLDGLRHIIQPFANYSYVVGNGANPAEILQFDRYIPSTRLRPIDFPQFTTIDSIDDWSIARVGVRNRLQTRRDDLTINWAEMETYFDINFDNPYDRTNFSNVFNNVWFNPVPWVSIGVGTQLPLLEEGFTEVNTGIRLQPIANLAVNFEHRFLNENPFFQNSSLYTMGLYYRINDHWAAGGFARYEASTGFLEEQRYTIYRDLTSWVASLGGVIRNNGGIKEYGVLLTFTVKALPKFSFNLNFDPGAPGGEENASGVFP
jgi:lipopolysaccharide export system protein LptA